jgi:hypothetical protein
MGLNLLHNDSRVRHRAALSFHADKEVDDASKVVRHSSARDNGHRCWSTNGIGI